MPLDINVMFDQKLDYIHDNPVKAGICFKSEDYIYSSAGFYAGRESVLEIDTYLITPDRSPGFDKGHRLGPTCDS